MAPPQELKHYTITFNCNYAVIIPCTPTSSDADKVYPIDKPCPQCLPHPFLMEVVFDQAHWNEVHARQPQQQLSLREVKFSPRKGKGVSPDRSDVGSLGATSGTSSRGSKGSKESMKSGLRTLKRVIKGKSNLRELEQPGDVPSLDGEGATVTSESEISQSPIEDGGKKKDVEKKSKENEAEMVLEKVKEIEKGLVGLFNDRRGKLGRL